MELLDSHAHYNDEKFDSDREKVLNEIYNSGVTTIINAGYSIESSKKAIEIANEHEFIYATVGVSPNDIDNLEEDYIEELKQMSKAEKVVAIGEIGLDYYWNKENKEKQQEVFIKQIELANELELPIVIHTREAVMDTLDILKNKVTCKNKGVFHCCPLNIELAKEALKLGFYISCAGPITFKSSKNATDFINTIPMDKILIETDSPYLSPEPVRGTRNNSSNVKYVAQKIAEIKQISIEEVAEQIYQNAKTIFKLGDKK